MHRCHTEFASRVARRDALDTLRAHVDLDPAIQDEANCAWWRNHRAQLAWQSSRHLWG